MSKRVFVSGYGIVSALGLHVGENLAMLRRQKSGIGPPSFLKTSHREMMVGEVKYSNAELSKIANFPYQESMSRTALLGMVAAQEAIATAGLSPALRKSAGLANGTSVGGMDISEHAYKAMLENLKINYQESFYGHDCGRSTQTIAQHLGLRGYSATISTACSSSANTIMHAARLIKSGQLDCMVAGGTDALSVFTLNGFNSLKILDTEWCKPFDENRNGLNLGEGAAFLVLESEDFLQKRNGKALAELIGYGNANDAYHQTASSPEGKGAYLAIKKAFEVAGNPGLVVDYVNAHGTGTKNNDQSENMALNMIFHNQIPPYSSTKSYTGHTLAAAGAIEAVFSILSIQHQILLPNLNLSTPLDTVCQPVTKLQSAPIKTVLSNSFGFGGNCSSVIFAGV
jgi:3-oxoacyl-(acyl-carrier-protein) synthase